MAITIRPLGGLGNQLFVYATGLTLARKRTTELVADLSLLREKPSPQYQLDSFANSISRVEPASEREVSSPRMRQILSRFRPSSVDNTFKERGFWFDPRIMEIPDGSTIDGYFQSWKYFYGEEETLRREIQSVRQPTPSFLQLKTQLAKEQPWIGVHVRRGDYTAIAQMGITEDFYYERALDVVQRLSGVEAVRVFSDDIAAASKLPSLAGNSNVEFMVPAAESSPLENLLCLADAHHLIMANSSFSWWAAWLLDKPSRIVTYPRPWVDFRSVNDRDLTLPNWIGLGRESIELAVQRHVGY